MLIQAMICRKGKSFFLFPFVTNILIVSRVVCKTDERQSNKISESVLKFVFEIARCFAFANHHKK